MPDSGYLALFLVGLLGGTHCVGMCGGIVGALSMGVTARWSMHLAYNAGRILSYVAAGALRMMAHYILDPTLQAVDQLAPQLRFRDKLTDAYHNAKDTL